MAQILFDINRSLKARPPQKQHGEGVIHIKREKDKLSELIVEDENGVSKQAREKEVEEHRAEGETITFKQDGVLYNKDVMVAELRPDGKKELISGWNRREYLLDTYGEDAIYFWDLVKFKTPFDKVMWKRRYNSGDDHRAQGVPNKIGDYIKGLNEAKRITSFKWRDDNEVKLAIDKMANGKKSEKQIDTILAKFRKTNSKEINVRALNTNMANSKAKELNLPVNGHNKSTGEIGFVRHGGDFGSKITQWIECIDENNGTPIKITGFIEEIVFSKIDKQRKTWLENFNKRIQWLRDKGLDYYADRINFIGFLAQITIEDANQGGKPKERGLVDVNGKIIKE
jgi:hypothetical protein